MGYFLIFHNIKDQEMFNFVRLEAMRFTTIALLVEELVLFVSCGNTPKNSSNGNSFDGNSLDEANNSEYVEQAQMVTCPMCNGTGVFDFMPGDVIAPKQTCSACNGNGVCDENTAQQVMKTKAQVDAMMGGKSTGSYSSSGSGRSAYDVEYDLKKAYELLESMEEDYNNCTSVVLKTQYPRMIADQKECIRQLEAELRNAQ